MKRSISRKNSSPSKEKVRKKVKIVESRYANITKPTSSKKHLNTIPTSCITTEQVKKCHVDNSHVDNSHVDNSHVDNSLVDNSHVDSSHDDIFHDDPNPSHTTLSRREELEKFQEKKRMKVSTSSNGQQIKLGVYSKKSVVTKKPKTFAFNLRKDNNHMQSIGVAQENDKLNSSHDPMDQDRKHKHSTDQDRKPDNVETSLEHLDFELWENLYYQVCFINAKLQESFRVQELKAQKEIYSAWKYMQTLQMSIHENQEYSRKLQQTKALNHQISLEMQLDHSKEDFQEFQLNLMKLESSLKQVMNRMSIRDVVYNDNQVCESLRSVDQCLHEMFLKMNDVVFGKKEITVQHQLFQGIQQNIKKADTLLVQCSTMLHQLKNLENHQLSLNIQEILHKRRKSCINQGNLA